MFDQVLGLKGINLIRSEKLYINFNFNIFWKRKVMQNELKIKKCFIYQIPLPKGCLKEFAKLLKGGQIFTGNENRTKVVLHLYSFPAILIVSCTLIFFQAVIFPANSRTLFAGNA